VRESLSDAVARARKAWSDAGTVDTSPQATGRTRILSMREVGVLRAVATGATNREIAHQLVLSEYTVMRHVSNILRKLDAPSRAAAISSATRSGII
jgi:DNA-binding NarL/FixJ family response regulator